MPISTQGPFPKFPYISRGENDLIYIEFIDTPLDYNILLGCSYMYIMKAVASSMFITIIFPHNWKVLKVEKMKHYEPLPTKNLDNILPLIGAHHKFPSFVEMGPRIFKDSSLLHTYQGEQHFVSSLDFSQVCTITYVTT